jgi:DNA-binding response OmpR family regulator
MNDASTVPGAIGEASALPRALVVEDEVPLARLVSAYLMDGGFEVAEAFDGQSALVTARGFLPDLVVLDLGLPGLDGTDVCRELRTFSNCYVLMLTARSGEHDKLEGLSIGADDYLTKPFSPRELVARAQVMLRRPRTSGADSTKDRVVIGGLLLDLATREIRVDGEDAEVTATEFALIAALAARAGQACSRRELIEAVWGANWVGDEHLVDVHVRNLRRKLRDDAANPRFIRTVRGLGYLMGPG